MITIIAAISKNYVLGKDGDLLWHIPEDLKRFKQITYGHPMIMGRKTFESFPQPLPGRKHIVLSNSEHVDSEDIKWVEDIQKAFEVAKRFDDEIFIIGGGKVFAQTLDKADKIELTIICENFLGDTYFPKFDQNNWKLIDSKEGNDKKFKLKYNTYIKNKKL